jgi:hypothetical protein
MRPVANNGFQKKATVSPENLAKNARPVFRPFAAHHKPPYFDKKRAPRY